MAAATLVALSTPASAQAPKARHLAAKGLEYTDKPVRETHIAAGTNRVMPLYMQTNPAGGHRVGYAFAVVVEHIPPGMGAPSQKPWRWVEEGLVPFSAPDFDPNDPENNAGDPSVAYDTVTGNFVLAGQYTPGRIHYPIVARYNATLEEFDWGGWTLLQFGDGSPVPACDKPWLVAGDVIPGNPPQQEFYICYTGMGAETAHLIYARSVNGGDTWYGGVADPAGDELLLSYVHSAAHPDGSFYVACFNKTEQHFQFVHGQDPGSPEQPMTWEYLDTDLDPYNGVLEVSTNTSGLAPYIPTGGHFGVEIFPNLAVDPLDPNNLCVVYHDTVEPPPDPPFVDADVDVFLRVLTKQPDGTWAVGDRVPVNDPDDPNAASPSDQFFPAMTVDPLGRIHVIFYDDRDFEYQTDYPDPNDPNAPDPTLPKFNAYYAYSENIDLGFPEDDRELYQVPPERAVDYAVIEGQGGGFRLEDYIGITWGAEAQGYRIWTSFTGTHADDPTEHDSVIYSSQIPWPFP
jgi:hypothetical protein